MEDTEERLAEALKNILWKLNRKTLNSESQCEWAKIDRNDIVIRDAQRIFDVYNLELVRRLEE